jgi:hypothetical protein
MSCSTATPSVGSMIAASTPWMSISARRAERSMKAGWSLALMTSRWVKPSATAPTNSPCRAPGADA